MKNTLSKGIAKACVALFILVAVGTISASGQSKKSCTGDDGCCAKTKKSTKALACKLTSKEMQERKATIIAALKKEVLERKELRNGYSYKFKGDDQSIDQLTAFIKSERQCCDFFNFSLSVRNEFAYLELTGPKGAKEFIEAEIGM